LDISELLLQSGNNNQLLLGGVSMAERRAGYRQIFDVRASVIASVVGVIAFWLTMMALDSRSLSAPWFTTYAAATLISGPEALASPTVFNMTTALSGLAVYLGLGLVFGIVISALIHEFGLIVGIIGGAVLGFCTYVLLYYIATNYGFSHDLAKFARAPLEVGHVVFGAVVGGVYESLERARYVRG
jgi:hypothetical protein